MKHDVTRSTAASARRALPMVAAFAVAAAMVACGDATAPSDSRDSAAGSAGVAALAEDPLEPGWDRYHTSAEADALLAAWADQWPEITELYSIGETLTGSPLMVLEITNEATGAGAEKPAYYYDGNIHAGELTGAEVALHFAWHVLRSYGSDPRITALLDTRTLYVRPKFNPDGADIALTSAQTLRSTPRPYDQDLDGLLDEDPPNDLDGDGHITRMRIPDPEGAWYVSSEDPRVMLRRPGAGGGRGGPGGGGGRGAGGGRRGGPTGGAAPGGNLPEGARGGQPAGGSQGPPQGTRFYDVVAEGTDDDDDGRINEDGFGGIDMNRNFPRNWGMEFEQNGAGPYPLSEPETRATIEFLNGHRNITGIFHGHTSGGFAYRLPSTTAWENFVEPDQELILEQSAKYEETTGQPARPSYTNPEVHRHGTLISWGYWDFGVVGFVPEFWAGFGTDYDGDGNVTELERLRFHDEELANSYFTDWSAHLHPELGEVEIGGWHTKFTNQNPPTELLRGEVELYVEWMLWLAEIAPQIEIRDVGIEPGAGTDEYRVRVTIENVGYLPTNLTQRALDAAVAVPVRALAELVDAELIEGTERADIGHLAGRRPTAGPGAPTSSVGTVEYVVRTTGSSPAIDLTVISEKGGTVRQRIDVQT